MWFQQSEFLLFHSVSTPPASSGNATKWLGDGRNTTWKSIYLKGRKPWCVGRFALITYGKLLERLVLPGCFSISLQWEDLVEKAGFISCNLKHLGIRHIVYTSHLGSLYIQWKRQTPSSLFVWAPRDGYVKDPLLDFGQSILRKIYFSSSVLWLSKLWPSKGKRKK